MIKIACLNYNNTFFANYNNHEIAIYYFNDINEIEKADFFGIIIINDRLNINLNKSVVTVKNKGFEYIYVVEKDIDQTRLNEIIDLGITDFFSLPLHHKLLSFKIIKDYKEFNNKTNSHFAYDNLYIDIKSQMVFINNDLIDLTSIEYKLLIVLTQNANKAMSREELVDNVWNYTTKDYRSLETHIKTLRKKLDIYKTNIITIWGFGYSFTTKNM